VNYIIIAVLFFILFFLTKVLLGVFSPITVTAAKLFDQTLRKNGVDWRCLKPVVKEEIVSLCINISSFGNPPNGMETKAKIAEDVEFASKMIANYIKTGNGDSEHPYINIFNKYHKIEEFHRID